MTVTAALPLNGLIRGVTMLSLGLLLAYTWVLTGVGKLRGGGPPDGFQESFGATWLATFPGLTIAFYSIAVMEVIGALLATGSLLAGEFARRSSLLLRLALVQSLLIFVQLGFGKRLIADHAGAHDLFVYAAATLVMLLAVMRLDESNLRSPTSGSG